MASPNKKGDVTAARNNRIRLLVLRELCRHDCDFMSCWVPLPTTVIAHYLNLSLYKVRKAMKQLVAEGLAVRTACVLDLEDSLLPYNGFHITSKGKSTGIYMYVSLRCARIAAACFDANVESFLPSGFNPRWLHKTERRTENNPANFTAGLEKEMEETIC